MTVYVATGNPIKLRAVEAVLREFAWTDPVVGVAPRLDLPEQPLGAGVERGASLRARAAFASGAEPSGLGIGIEAGLIQLPSSRWVSTQVCAIAGEGDRMAIGLGPGYVLPERLLAAVLGGEPLRRAFERDLRINDPERRGAVHFLSGGRVDREALTRSAVRMAIVSWMDGALGR